jgi:hypothetical protein
VWVAAMPSDEAAIIALQIMAASLPSALILVREA